MKTTAKIIQALEAHANPEKASILRRFFKTGVGQYGEGDKFIGVVVPDSRTVANEFKDLATTDDVQTLLNNPVHEVRLTALLLIVEQFKKASPEKQKEIFDTYLAQTNRINNWDLVDLSAPQIVGTFLLERSNRKILIRLAKSKLLWERRIAIIATFAFIKNNQFEDTFKIAELLLQDKHDLIHKAVGWMLREVGKRNQKAEETFLTVHAKTMPLTMLRYAIERFDERKRKHYLYVF